MVRRLRTMNQVVKYIKREDSGSAINRHIIETLVLSRKVFNQKIGNVTYVDLDECLNVLNILLRG